MAVVENGMLQELHIERACRRGLVGNIYKGRVQRVMPGMQAAFVEIGLERAAFLHAGRHRAAAPIARGRRADRAAPPTRRSAELVREGQEIVVQVVKDPIGSKGARLTTQSRIPSRYLVLLPLRHGVGVSARIEDEAERARLRERVHGCVQRRRVPAATSCAPMPKGQRRGAGRGHGSTCAALGLLCEQARRRARRASSSTRT